MRYRTMYIKKIAVSFVKPRRVLLYFSINKATKSVEKGFRQKIIYAMGVLIITMPIEQAQIKYPKAQKKNLDHF